MCIASDTAAMDRKASCFVTHHWQRPWSLLRTRDTSQAGKTEHMDYSTAEGGASRLPRAYSGLIQGYPRADPGLSQGQSRAQECDIKYKARRSQYRPAEGGPAGKRAQDLKIVRKGLLSETLGRNK